MNVQLIEIWKPILGYEGYYEISNLGNVCSLSRTIINSLGYKKTIKTRILKQGKDTDGYPQVVLYKNNKPNYCKVHILVAQTFLINIDNKPMVNHKDGIKINNRENNLEWATSSENTQHAYDTGLKHSLKGYDNVLSKSVVQYDMKLNKITNYGSTCEAERMTGISRRCISYCANGKTKWAGGFIWRFIL